MAPVTLTTPIQISYCFRQRQPFLSARSTTASPPHGQGDPGTDQMRDANRAHTNELLRSMSRLADIDTSAIACPVFTNVCDILLARGQAKMGRKSTAYL